ncbi:MAG: hypothetical protein LIO62_02125 [Clostridiales bacterium]|nr:hypothetical protein [Clostridiales bacterium]
MVEEYNDNVEQISYAMLQGAADAENIGNLATKVWYNAIWEKSSTETDAYTKYSSNNFWNFSTALANLYADEDFASDVSDLKTDKEAVTLWMKDMANPPEECEEAYDDLKEYYNSYIELVNLVVSPSGSYNDFSDAFSSADSECVSCYNQMKLYFE